MSTPTAKTIPAYKLTSLKVFTIIVCFLTSTTRHANRRIMRIMGLKKSFMKQLQSPSLCVADPACHLIAHKNRIDGIVWKFFLFTFDITSVVI